jgi:opacity protein-like surface antigen
MIVDIKKRALKQLLTGVCLLLTIHTSAQVWGIEAFGGIANYQGDLQEKKYTIQGAGFALGLGASYAFNPHLSLRAILSYGKVSADDKRNSDPQLVNRNLNFTSNIMELSFVGQLHLFNSFKSRINPYVMAGIAVFRHNPYTFDTLGAKYFLQPLGTEGQGLSRYPDKQPYGLTQFAIPFGAGIKFTVNEAISIGWEIGARKTFTDYLDDVSGRYADRGALLSGRGPKAVELAFRTGEIKSGADYPTEGTIRGGSRYDDWYYFSGITITYRFMPYNELTFNGKPPSSTECPKKIF